ncbi:MAG: hypothetical protein QW369_05275 [Desulfurococcaceae archaeon]
MPSINEGSIVIEYASIMKLVNRDLGKLYALLNEISSRSFHILDEPAVAIVEVGSERTYLALGVNSLLIEDQEFSSKLKSIGAEFYVIAKRTWANYSNTSISKRIGELLSDSLEALPSKCFTIRTQGVIIGECGEPLDHEVSVLDKYRSFGKAIPLKPYHPVIYGVYSHAFFSNKDYSRILKKYLSELTQMDPLVYGEYCGDLVSLIEVSEVRRRVKINYVSECKEYVLLLLNAIFWIIRE